MEILSDWEVVGVVDTLGIVVDWFVAGDGVDTSGIEDAVDDNVVDNLGTAIETCGIAGWDCGIDDDSVVIDVAVEVFNNLVGCLVITCEIYSRFEASDGEPVDELG